jgi:hypothetical protein
MLVPVVPEVLEEVPLLQLQGVVALVSQLVEA